MFVNDANPQVVKEILSNVKIKNSVGMDGFKIDHLKIENTINFLCPLINSIIKSDVWPDKLKTQVLRPIYKKGDKLNLDNYRPIALQPAINKIIEKSFAMRIQNFLVRFNIITENQYGFQKNKGTGEAIKDLNDKVTTALDKGKYTGLILIDLQKAFDTISRKILLKKMELFGMRGKILQI